MSLHIKERLEQLRHKRDKGKVLRALDEDDREALAYVESTVRTILADGMLSFDEILTLGHALDVLREARSNTE